MPNNNQRRLDNVRSVALSESINWAKPEQLTELEPTSTEFESSMMGPLQAVTDDIHRIVKCPMGLAGSAVLGVASLAAQGRHDIEFLSRPRPLSLFILSIAASGERKSSAEDLASLGVAEFEEELRRRSTNPGAKIDGKIDLNRYDNSLPPCIRMNDGTTEGIMRGFVEGHPSQTFSTDEAGRFLAGHSMQRENRMKGLTSLSKFWDGRTDTKRLKGTGEESETTTVRDCRLSVHLQGQRVAIAPFLNDPMASGQGILARFLVHEPGSTIGTRMMSREEWGQEHMTPAIREFADLAKTHLRRAAKRKDDGSVFRPLLKLSPEASELLRLFFNDVEENLGTGGLLAGKSDLANKAHENAARIAGVLAVFQGEKEVSAATMQNAIGLASYYLKELIRLSEIAPSDTAAAKALTLAKWLHSRGGQAQTRMLSRRGPKGLRRVGDRKDPMDLLQAAGWLVVTDEGWLLLNPRCIELGIFES